MITVCETKGRLYVAREGRLRSFRLDERAPVRSMLDRLSAEGRINTCKNLRELRAMV